MTKRLMHITAKDKYGVSHDLFYPSINQAYYHNKTFTDFRLNGVATKEQLNNKRVNEEEKRFDNCSKKLFDDLDKDRGRLK